MKVAIGGVHRQEFFDGLFTNGRINALEGVGAQQGLRKVWSGFGELFMPIFSGNDNAMGGFQRLDISLSARHDSYSDFGSTTNPKIGVNWEPLKGLHPARQLRHLVPRTGAARSLWPGHACGLPEQRPRPSPASSRPTSPGGIFIAGRQPEPRRRKGDHLVARASISSRPSCRASRRAATYYNVKFKGRVAFPSSSFFYRDPAFNQFFVSNNVCTTGAPTTPASPDTVRCRPQPIPVGAGLVDHQGPAAAELPDHGDRPERPAADLQHHHPAAREPGRDRYRRHRTPT